jgi:hypothetical protein
VIVSQAAILSGAPKEIGVIKGMTMAFDWHSEPITRATPLDKNYRNTQNVRRFLISQCGEAFKFDRPFMAWIKSNESLTMGEVADEWLRLNRF